VAVAEHIHVSVRVQDHVNRAALVKITQALVVRNIEPAPNDHLMPSLTEVDIAMARATGSDGLRALAVPAG
jgi:hypothetical protein